MAEFYTKEVKVRFGEFQTVVSPKFMVNLFCSFVIFVGIAGFFLSSKRFRWSRNSIQTPNANQQTKFPIHFEVCLEFPNYGLI